MRNLEGKLAARYPNWDRQSGGTDPMRYDALIRVRNGLAHGNQHQIAELRRQGFSDTVSWARQQVPVLNRAARALDRIMSDYLRHRTGEQPW